MLQNISSNFHRWKTLRRLKEGKKGENLNEEILKLIQIAANIIPPLISLLFGFLFCFNFSPRLST